MPIRRTEKYRWEHHSGAYAYLDELGSHMVSKNGKAHRQGHLHVFVPEEHRRNGISRELLEKAISDLGRDNLELKKENRFYRVFSRKINPPESSVKAYKKAGFHDLEKEGETQAHEVPNY